MACIAVPSLVLAIAPRAAAEVAPHAVASGDTGVALAAGPATGHDATGDGASDGGGRR